MKKRKEKKRKERIIKLVGKWGEKRQTDKEKERDWVERERERGWTFFCIVHRPNVFEEVNQVFVLFGSLRLHTLITLGFLIAEKEALLV
jgi:hypothetical protein